MVSRNPLDSDLVRKIEIPARALELLRDEIYDDMSLLSPNSEEWCTLAEEFIELAREIKKRR